MAATHQLARWTLRYESTSARVSAIVVASDRWPWVPARRILPLTPVRGLRPRRVAGTSDCSPTAEGAPRPESRGPHTPKPGCGVPRQSRPSAAPDVGFDWSRPTHKTATSRRWERRDGQLETKVALVTGANAGIGMARARWFVGEGAQVYVTGRARTQFEAAVADIGGDFTGPGRHRGHLYAARRLARLPSSFGTVTTDGDLHPFNSGAPPATHRSHNCQERP
ncbi:MAG: SDR family NAD(P)-dependent oxidoreductase [Actinomycetota bacterium]